MHYSTDLWALKLGKGRSGFSRRQTSIYIRKTSEKITSITVFLAKAVRRKTFNSRKYTFKTWQNQIPACYTASKLDRVLVSSLHLFNVCTWEAELVNPLYPLPI